MSSVDGRLLPSRWSLPFDGTPAGELFRKYAAIGSSLSTNAWMFGKSTTCEFFPDKFISQSSCHPEVGKVYIGNRTSPRLFITIDPDADILFTADKLRGDNIITVIGTNATVDYLAMLEDRNISYIVVHDATDLHEIMHALFKQFGVKRISLQGGGIINGAMLAAGLIDELSLVIYPGIDGLTTSPSIFEYLGASDENPATGQSLELKSFDKLEHGIIWLRYRFHHKL